MGRSQAVRQRVLASSVGGSNPPASAYKTLIHEGEMSEWSKELDC